MRDGLARRTWADLRSHWRVALAFHLLMQVAGAALVTPVLTWIARRLVLSSGEPVISNFDIAAFALSPTGGVFILVIAALSVALLLAEFAGLSFIADKAVERRVVTLASTIAYVACSIPRVIALSTRVFVRLVLLALPFVAAAGLVWLTMLHGHDINFYLAEHPPEWRRAKLIAAILVAGYVLLAAWQLARWLYAVPILVAEGGLPRHALARSSVLTQGRAGRIVMRLVAWWALLTLAATAITWLCRYVSDAGLDWAGLDVHRVLPLVAVYLAVTLVGSFLYGGIGLAGHQFLVTRLYAEQCSPERRGAAAAGELPEERSRLIARPVLLGVVALLVVGLAATAFLVSQLDLKGDAAITAHRGAKVSAPENTLASFRAALDAGADYVELDVQHTRDGRVVVIHDGDLMRMGDDPRKVADLTLEEIQAIDIGRKYDPRFAGEHVPTLEQVIDLVRGRAKINVELKYNVPDPGLAPDVVHLLRRTDFIDQVVITSLDYAALKEVKRLEPRLRTGHIVTAAIGNVLRTEADFLSLNSARASAALVRRAHARGKDVAVWTVNDPEVMLRMIERGVDNVITDDPALLVRVMRERKGLSKAEILGLRLRVLFSRPPREVTDPDAVETL